MSSNKDTRARVTGAFRAMKAIGIPEEKVKPVLKSLLKLYDKNWELIEEENYRALADAIFEREESQEPPRATTSQAPERAKEIANSEVGGSSKKILNNQAEETQVAEEPERPLKRLRRGQRDGQTSSINASDHGTNKTSLIVPKEEPIETITPPINGSTGSGTAKPSTRSQTLVPTSLGKDKGKQPVSAEPLTINERCDPSQPSVVTRNQQKSRLETEPKPASHSMRLRDRRSGAGSPQNTAKESNVDHGIVVSPEKKSTSKHALIKPKDEPVTNDMPSLEPLAVSRLSPTDTSKGGGSSRRRRMLIENGSPEPSAVQSFGEKGTADDGTTALNPTTYDGELPVASIDCSSKVEIASFISGEARIYLNCHLASERTDFHVPSLEAVLKYVEEKCFKPTDSNISMTTVMKEICQGFLELGTNSSVRSVDISPDADLSKFSADGQGSVGGLCTGSLNDLSDSRFGTKLPEPQETVPSTDRMNDGPQDNMNVINEIVMNKEIEENDTQETNVLALEDFQQPPETPSDNIDIGVQKSKADSGGEMETNCENQGNCQVTNGQSLEVVQQSKKIIELSTPSCQVLDIAKGQEKVMISLVNEVNDEAPPCFYYIPQNAAFKNAYVNFSLARIGNKNCCAGCSKDCLSSPTPCACAHESGGEFAYTSDGLVKEKLLKECISMNRDPKKHCQYFCKECPLERSKCADTIEPCKGHSVRKFIKECWWKCGCNMQCGNRVVQRGISRNLQVFMAPGGKGWGLRTLEDLPAGAFVCEYVGEVLTNAELFDRVQKSPEGEKHSYPVLLDADWYAEAVLKDEEALCLDATYYGNVARFINHRCYDSNLVEIPVEVETPDHHYYHLAFFTTRKVKAMEELTWDYGIDFDDHEHPIKAFRCQCGSKFCRNIKRSRSRSKRW